jgi:asparaginyl-tRNA synthetase
MTRIQDLAAHVGQAVELKGWNAQKRDSKGLVFMTFRDGTGFCQAVINLEVVGEASFEVAKRLPQESSLAIKGTVICDEKQVGGYEIQVTALTVIAEA